MVTHSQYSCLENSLDREAWWATVHMIAKSWTQLSKHACMHKKLSKKHDKWQRNKDQKMREVEGSQMSPNIYKTGIPKMGIEQMKQTKSTRLKLFRIKHKNSNQHLLSTYYVYCT